MSDTQHKGDRTGTAKGWITNGPLLICLALYAFHAYVIYKHAVNVPYWDEWSMFAGDSHPASIDLGWLHAQHNEHRVATTKIFVWLQFNLNGWNYVANLLIDFAIFGVLLAYLVRFVRKTAPLLPFWVVFSFMIFLLSPINWFSHFSAMQAAFHFHLLFFFIACTCLFDERQRFRELLIACIAAVLCIYSSAGGFVTSIVLLGAFSLFKGMRIYQAAGKRIRRELLQMILVLGIVGAALATWTIGYTKPFYHPALIYPATVQFWVFFANLVSLGFGFLGVSSMLGALCLLIVLIPVGGEIWKRRHNLASVQWTAYVVVLAMLANLASISAGRAGFGVAVAKSGRYVELVAPFVLLSVCHWAIFLRDQKALRTGVLIALWFFCFAGFARKWDFGIYKAPSAARLEGLRCVESYYRGAGDGLCPTICPSPIAEQLEQAKRLNASFYRELKIRDSGKAQTADTRALPEPRIYAKLRIKEAKLLVDNQSGFDAFRFSYQPVTRSPVIALKPREGSRLVPKSSMLQSAESSKKCLLPNDEQ